MSAGEESRPCVRMGRNSRVSFMPAKPHLSAERQV